MITISIDFNHKQKHFGINLFIHFKYSNNLLVPQVLKKSIFRTVFQRKCF